MSGKGAQIGADLTLIGFPMRIPQSFDTQRRDPLKKTLLCLETHTALDADEPAYYWQWTLRSYFISSHPSKSEFINAESGLGQGPKAPPRLLAG
ncbi:uncharacterized protein N7500_001000 [Penicillium coprophilum]|uniref:uncharacterized protein n=1 Tax=Penicillium coprophilum TaxID=36646 RepID=UPI0023893BF5|nr:uncharacterized protein N7500_001000 [Penicillium coprophilum]KAJ5178301.1 hypothetical protein N7500_001000 [Penicillium coprophilum]